MVKASFRDIARLAGVGTATVERVLNGRGGVSPETTEKVVVAARALEYPRTILAQHRGLMRIEVLMVRPETTFYARLSKAFARIAASLDPLVVVQRNFTDESNPSEIAARIHATEPRRAALILAVPNSREVERAVDAVAARGTPVIHVVTRASPNSGEFVGIDNQAAGRSAALFMNGMARHDGQVIALCHPIYQVHRDRVAGFSDYLQRHGRRLEFERICFSNDEEARGAELLSDILGTHPEITGIYNVGGGNAALIKVLGRHPRGKDIFFVGHELTDYTASALRDGIMDVVLDQAPEAQARRALDIALRRIGLTEIETDRSPIRFVTVTAESI